MTDAGPESFCARVSGITQRYGKALALDGSGAQAGFTRAVNYTAGVADWAATPASATTAATASGINQTAVGSGGVLAATPGV